MTFEILGFFISLEGHLSGLLCIRCSGFVVLALAQGLTLFFRVGLDRSCGLWRRLVLLREENTVSLAGP